MQATDLQMHKGRLLTSDEWLQQLIDLLIGLEDAKYPLKKHYLKVLVKLILYNKSILIKAVKVMQAPEEWNLDQPLIQAVQGQQPQQAQSTR